MMMKKTDTKDTIRSDRRGNVLILVAGILVLLLITGFSYLSRTRTERKISIAQRESGRAQDIGRALGNMVADEVSQALFPRPIDIVADSNPGNGFTENPNIPRMPISVLAPRYGLDVDYGGTGRPNLWWNHAKYEVIPWTNWPDGFTDLVNTNISPRSDDIPGNPGTADFRILCDFEPARWLFDPTPPQDTSSGNFGQDESGADASISTPDIVEYFSHWQHMSNPMRPGNGWMVVPFIDDIEGSVATVAGLPLGPWGTPFEQWLPHTVSGAGLHGRYLPTDFNTAAGKSFITDAALFTQRWQNWFLDYENTVNGGSFTGIPGNFYHLSDCGFDLDGDSVNQRLEFGERPEDAFIGPGRDPTGFYVDGTPRWNIERVLADADGDGATDSFWFLAPVPVSDDLRTLVALRVVDLSGAVDINVTTPFVRGRPEPGNNLFNHGTRGQTPADIALTETIQPTFDGLDMSYSSFLTNPEHTEISVLYPRPSDFPGSPIYRSFLLPGGDGSYPDGAAPLLPDSTWGTIAPGFDPGQWQGNEDAAPFEPTITSELGLNNDFLKNPLNRLDYWRRSGLHPFEPKAADPGSLFSGIDYRPFSVSDMLDLWGFNASNSPWTSSRLERAFQQSTTSRDPSGVPMEMILRNSAGRQETQPYLDELDVRPTNNFPFDEYLHDLRHRLTLISGARNETMPAWMWWENRWVGAGLASNFGTPAFSNPNDPSNPARDFLRQNRLKLDLREEPDVLSGGDNARGIFSMPQLLAWRILSALAENPTLINPGPPVVRPRSYYFDPSVAGNKLIVDDLDQANGLILDAQVQREFEQTARAAAGVAANALSYRDNDVVIDPFTGSNSMVYLPYISIENDAVPIPVEQGNVTDAPGRIHQTRRMLGMEIQPFLAEVFIAHVFDTVVAQFAHPSQGNSPAINPFDHVAAGNIAQGSVVAVQLANPFDKPIPLLDGYGNNIFWLNVFDQTPVPLYDPLRSNRVQILPGQAVTYYILPVARGDAEFDKYRFALDLQVNGDVDPDSPMGDIYDPNNERFDIEYVNAQSTLWSTDPYDYGSGDSERAVEITRSIFNNDPNIPNSPLPEVAQLVIDRIDIHGDGMLDDDFEFGETVLGDLNSALPSSASSSTEPAANQPWPGVRRIDATQSSADRWMEWVRVSREWDKDVIANQVLDDTERNPRYIYSFRGFDDSGLQNQEQGFDSSVTADNWFNEDFGVNDTTRPTRFYPFLTDTTQPSGRLPLDPGAFFDKNVDFGNSSGPNQFNTPRYALQMLQKDADFDTVGELRNVWIYGHMIKVLGPTAGNRANLLDTSQSDGGTIRTFAEFMVDGGLVGMDRRVNRLRVMPEEVDFDGDTFVHSRVLGLPQLQLTNDPRYMQPELPAGARLFEAFVCDGAGANLVAELDYFNLGSGLLYQPIDFNGDGIPALNDREDRGYLQFRNAAGYAGQLTPGLININSAPREGFRALPGMGRLVHETDLDDSNVTWPHLPVLDPGNPSNLNPNREYNAGRIRVPEAIEAYRERYGIVNDSSSTRGLLTTVPDFRPAYGARGLRQDLWNPPPPGMFWDPQLDQSRGERGFASIGEVAMLNRTGRAGFMNPPPTAEEASQWLGGFSVEAAGNDILGQLNFWANPNSTIPPDVDVSIDLIDRIDPITGFLVPDETRKDVEEANMLFSGISNLITTRSDVFGVWLKIRTVRQDSATGIWDGTRSDLIVDESRYFMVVDRSRVNSPDESPRILLFEKLSK